MSFNQSRIIANPNYNQTRVSTLTNKGSESTNSSGLLPKSLISSNVLGTNGASAKSWSLGLGIELDQIFSAAVGGSPPGCSGGIQSLLQQEELLQQEYQDEENDMLPPPPPATERRPAFSHNGLNSNTSGAKEDKVKGIFTNTGNDSAAASPSSYSAAINLDSARSTGSINGRRLSHPGTSVVTRGLEPSFDEFSPRPPSTSSSVATIRSDRMKDHARIFPTRLRTSSGSLREAYAGRHTPVIRSAGGFSDMASPALSTYSGRWGIPSGSVPGSGPSTPKAPVSRGEAGYMGKQTYIAFNKGAPRSAPMGYASTSHSMNSSFNFHGSQNDFHMHGADASGGAMSRRLVSLDSIYPYPWMTPTLHHAASARSPHDNMDSRFPPYGNISNVGSSSMAPMMRDAAAEEDRLDHELRALRRRGMTNDIYRSHSVGCLPHGANSSGSRSFQASVPGCYSPSTMTINRRPSIGSIRSLMTPIASGSQNLLAVDNGYSSSHSLSPSRPDATPESPAPSLPLPSIAGSLYQQQSYSQAPIRTEQKSGLRSVFSTPSLTSFARRRSSFSFKTALSSLVALPASPPSPTPSSISTSSSTASDLIISTPPIPSTDDLRESISGPPSAGVVLSADELMQAELSAIEMERAEQERAVTAATAAAAAAAAATSVPPSVLSLSPKDATMEETQPHGSLLGSQGTVSPNERSRASSVMSTDTDAMSAISTGSSFNQPTMLSMTRPPVPPHSHLSQSPNSHQPLPPLPQPFPLPLPPRQSSSRLLSIPRGGGDDGASINSSRSKRSIQLGNLKKMLKKPFSFAKELPLQRTLSSSAAKVVKATKGSKAATAAESPLLSDSSMRPSRQEERRSIRLPTKEDVRKFQWDYRRHVNPMHDDT